MSGPPNATLVRRAPRQAASDAALTDARRRSAATPGQVRATSQGATFGFSDELDAGSAALETGARNLLAKVGIGNAAPYSMGDAFSAVMQSEKEAMDQFAADHPVQNVAFQVAGGAPVGLGAGYIRGAQGAGRIARAGQVGAGYGALYGLGSSNGNIAERAPAAAVGAGLGAIGGGGAQAVGQAVVKPIAQRISGIAGAGQRTIAPSVAALRTAKNSAYDAVDDSGAVYSADQVKGLAGDVERVLKAEGLDSLLHRNATRMLRNIRSRGQDMSLTELDQLRQVIRRDVASSREAGEKYMGQRMIEALDEFVDGTPPAMGPEDAGGLITRARDLNTRVRKIDDIQGAVDEARLQAGSGGNVNNAIRQRLRAVLTRRNNFTPEESAALENIVVGTRGQNLLRQIGKLSPEGNGLMMALQLGAAGATGGASGVLAAGGAVSKRVADRQTMQAVDRLIAEIASGSGLPAEEQASAQALMRLKAVDLGAYRQAVTVLVNQAGDAFQPLPLAADPEGPPP